MILLRFVSTFALVFAGLFFGNLLLSGLRFYRGKIDVTKKDGVIAVLILSLVVAALSLLY